ncbi:hypothetical protein ACPCUV_33935 [Streptomyces platensis]|uniref:hypothetical protein n=1 Tax=Streptomyces platensis TaxID=58346 RepID=UPI003C2DC323
MLRQEGIDALAAPAPGPANVTPARLRALAERHFAQLKSRRLLHMMRISPGRVTVLLLALLAGNQQQHPLATEKTDSVRDSSQRNSSGDISLNEGESLA